MNIIITIRLGLGSIYWHAQGLKLMELPKKTRVKGYKKIQLNQLNVTYADYHLYIFLHFIVQKLDKTYLIAFAKDFR